MNENQVFEEEYLKDMLKSNKRRGKDSHSESIHLYNKTNLSNFLFFALYFESFLYSQAG